MASEDSVGYIAIVKFSPGHSFQSATHGTKKGAEMDAAEKAVKALGLLVGSEHQGAGHQAASGHTHSAFSTSHTQSELSMNFVM